MSRQFFIFSDWDGLCTVLEDGHEEPHACSDLRDAIGYVQHETPDDEVTLTAYDPFGKVTLSSHIVHVTASHAENARRI